MSDQQSPELDGATRRLIDQAAEARGNAHAPYSGFAVGAAVRAVDGRVFFGCNVEISSYGLTMCAERVALFAARAAGAQELEAIAVVGPGANGVPTPPCGACRQVIWDLAPKAEIFLATPAGRVTVRTAADLLPDPFGPAQLAAHHEAPDQGGGAEVAPEPGENTREDA